MIHSEFRLKPCKFIVKDKKQFYKIQELLFSLGARWFSDGTRFIPNDRFSYYKYCYVDVDGKIINLGKDVYHYEELDCPEIVLNEKTVYTIQEIEKRKVVKVGEVSYYEDELAEALKNIKPI